MNKRINDSSPAPCSAYTRSVLQWLRKTAMQTKGARSVGHLFPRAYCVAKPTPLCAVFVTPWIDAEPQVRTPEYSASHTVWEGVTDVRVGDWLALAYVVTDGVQQLHAFPLLTNRKVLYPKAEAEEGER